MYDENTVDHKNKSLLRPSLSLSVSYRSDMSELDDGVFVSHHSLICSSKFAFCFRLMHAHIGAQVFASLRNEKPYSLLMYMTDKS